MNMYEEIFSARARACWQPGRRWIMAWMCELQIELLTWRSSTCPTRESNLDSTSIFLDISYSFTRPDRKTSDIQSYHSLLSTALADISALPKDSLSGPRALINFT